MEKFDALIDIGNAVNASADWYDWSAAAAQSIAEPTLETLTLSNPDRKWELVSAYQKTVRRGDIALALRLCSAMASLETEKAYMWRRVCTTATEDIGPANPELMQFVIACSTVWTPAALDRNQLRGLFSYLTPQMCASARSRVYCQYSIMQSALKEGNSVKTMSATPLASKIKHMLTNDLKIDQFLTAPERWLVKNDWRGEGMLVGPIWGKRNPLPLTANKEVFEPVALIKGLPSYSYDKHTRAGKTTCYRLCGVQEFKAFFIENKVPDKADAIGWAMFFEEGGKIPQGLENAHLSALEHQVVADRHGLTFMQWLKLRMIFRNQLRNGTVDTIRADVLSAVNY